MKSATIYAAGSCNQRCKHCSVGLDHHSPRSSLTTSELNSVVSSLSQAGVSTITMLGGEVTYERVDLKEIYNHASNISAAISLNTNLTNRAAIEDIFAYSAFQVVVISLDGLSSRTHNLLRGRGQFRKTARNLIWLIRERKQRGLLFEIHVTFVINRSNIEEAVQALGRLKRLGVDKVNFNHLIPSGRAKLFAKQIGLSSKDIIETTAKVTIAWLLSQDVEMSIYIPPAVAVYFNRRWGVTQNVQNPVACGGPRESYGYVDLKGNHLPCPAMAKEENPGAQITARSDKLEIINNPASEVWATSLFRGFEKSRTKLHRNKLMWPCKVCRFTDECSPCTAPVIKGEQDPKVMICSALFEYVAENDPAAIGEIFPLTKDKSYENPKIESVAT